MITIYHLRYLLFLLLPLCCFISIFSQGIFTYFSLIFIFLVIPIVEFFFNTDHSNISLEQEQTLKNSSYFNFLLYSALPITYIFLYCFSMSVNRTMPLVDIIGKISSCGLILGALGINVAHELGHRKTPINKIISFFLLLPCFYTHFLIEHYIGHHARVSTIHDPATGRRGETIYQFWARSLLFSYLSAWQIQLHRLNRQGFSFFSLKNRLLYYQITQITFLAAIFFFCGSFTALCFLGAGLFGCLLLESINYIEHYGLERKMLENKKYEKVQPHHSWNSDHLISRFVLFELSRHSDHHFNSQRPFQILRYHSNSPQMPLGYPGMTLLALFPPIWFKVMHKRLDTFKSQ